VPDRQLRTVARANPTRRTGLSSGQALTAPAMGQTVASSRTNLAPGVVAVEANGARAWARALHGAEQATARPSAELARRLFATGGRLGDIIPERGDGRCEKGFTSEGLADVLENNLNLWVPGRRDAGAGSPA